MELPIGDCAGCPLEVITRSPSLKHDPVDVDCAGGSGNGPSYVTGPVRVTGVDVYGLDADGNGIGYE